ncbi:hypothetical protein KHA93_02890 [Bacillus sp. FJAT-49732]|uniref:Uncharacterized protein n=1 Tax=Lederbergia citrisecunda TaxID=2833583 RepID=A0A942TLV3_9BACI|nr:hypothetical protein [Lederbergia citrisecunda]MBS4198594.1 hypothetical protein [Lederbergia citrisecunda]
MDYKAFFAEVVDWINQSNQKAMKHGIDSMEFWRWVTQSTGEICNKYSNNPLVVKQMSMLYQWLEEVYENGKVNVK